MSDKSDWKKDFTAKLLRLAEPPDPDRATLAELRRCLGHDLGRVLYRVGWLFNRIQSDAALSDAMLVAALFASHQGNRAGASLGTAFRDLRDLTGSESIEKRFVALLDSAKEDLPAKLRQAVSLLKAKEIALDWEKLLPNLRQWENESRCVQRLWARDFWKVREAESPSTGDITPSDSISN
jgi:CRISPR system Cascade subunit CasB